MVSHSSSSGGGGAPAGGNKGAWVLVPGCSGGGRAGGSSTSHLRFRLAWHGAQTYLQECNGVYVCELVERKKAPRNAAAAAYASIFFAPNLVREKLKFFGAKI